MGIIPGPYRWWYIKWEKSSFPKASFLKMNNKEKSRKTVRIQRHIFLLFLVCSYFVLFLLKHDYTMLYTDYTMGWSCYNVFVYLECTIRRILRGVCWGRNKYGPRILEYSANEALESWRLNLSYIDIIRSLPLPLARPRCSWSVIEIGSFSGLIPERDNTI